MCEINRQKRQDTCSAAATPVDTYGGNRGRVSAMIRQRCLPWRQVSTVDRRSGADSRRTDHRISQLEWRQLRSGACGARPRRAYRACWSCGRVAEGTALLKRHTFYRVSRVRIPPAPPIPFRSDLNDSPHLAGDVDGWNQGTVPWVDPYAAMLRHRTDGERTCRRISRRPER